MEIIKKHEKGLEFEKKVAEFFRKKGYNKVLLRERVPGKSGIKHEIDVLVFDNLDQNKMLWACQCKHWNTQIGIKEIGEWIQTCRDIGVRPAFASLKFSSEAIKYAEANGVFLITDEQLGIEPSQVIGEDFLSWKEKLEAINIDVEKVLFCLKSIYQTELLQKAERAMNEPDEELRFEEPELFRLFRDQNDQRLTKFLIYLNKIKEEYGPSYAFGPLESFSWFKIPSVNTGAFNIPSEVGEVGRMIRSVLEMMDISDLEPFRMNWGDRCRIFLESWIQISEIGLLNVVCNRTWYPCRYASKSNYKPNYNMGDPNLDYDLGKRLLIGVPAMERWKEYFNEIRSMWKTILKDRSVEEIEKLGKLFETDLSVINQEDKLPNIDLSYGKKSLIKELFRKSRIIAEAYGNNKPRVEKIISDLKTEQ